MKSSTAADLTYTLAGGVRLTADAHSGILLDLSRGHYYSLTNSAIVICNAIKCGGTLATVLDSLRREYPRARGDLASDALSFLGVLVKRHLCYVK